MPPLPAPERLNRGPRLAIAAAALLHVLLCALNLVFIARSPLLTNLSVDLASYDRWARAIAGGDWVGSGIFYQDPLYPYLMAVVYALTGASVLHVLVLQVALAGLTVLLVGRLGTRLWSPAIGVAAAWTLALYRPAIYYAAMPEKACVSAFTLALAVLWLFEAVRRPTLLRGWRCGVVLGLAALLRGNVLLMAVVALALALAPRVLLELRRERLHLAGALLAGLATVLIPVLLRNRLVGGDWVLTTAQAGANLYIGNHPGNTTGSYVVPAFVRPTPPFEQEDFARHAEQVEGRDLAPSEVSSFYVREVLRWVAADPAAFLHLQWTKLRALLNAYEIPDNWSLYLVERFSPVLRLPLLGYGLLAPLALVGAAVALARRRRGDQVAYLLLVGTYALSLVAFYLFSRYRYPMAVLLPPLAVAGVAETASLARARRPLPLIGVGLVLVAAGALAFARPTIDPRVELSHRCTNLAAEHFQGGRLDEAEALCREALELDATNGMALLTLSRIAAHRGDRDAERDFLARALEARPGDEVILAATASGTAREKGYDAASAFVAGVLRGHESYLLRKTLIDLALAAGRLDEARRELERLLEVYPTDAWALDKRAALTPRRQD